MRVNAIADFVISAYAYDKPFLFSWPSISPNLVVIHQNEFFKRVCKLVFRYSPPYKRLVGLGCYFKRQHNSSGLSNWIIIYILFKKYCISASSFGGWLNIKMPSFQYRKSHCSDNAVLLSSYPYNGIPYTGKTASLYWIRALVSSWSYLF